MSVGSECCDSQCSHECTARGVLDYIMRILDALHARVSGRSLSTEAVCLIYDSDSAVVWKWNKYITGGLILLLLIVFLCGIGGARS